MSDISTDLAVPEDAPPVEYVDALWVCPSESQLPDNTVLIPGETIVRIPEPEAIASDNWEVVSGDDGKVTKTSLRKEAKALGLDIPTRATKPQLEELIATHREQEATEEAAESEADQAAADLAGESTDDPEGEA